MWELDHKEGWAPKNFCFQTMVLEKTWALWTARRSNRSILKEINLEYTLEGLVLKLKGQYFGHLLWRTDLLEKTLVLGKIDSRRRKGWQTEDEMVGWHHQLDGHEFEQALGVGNGQGSLASCSPWAQRVRHNWVTEQQQHLLGSLSVALHFTVTSVSGQESMGSPCL